MDGTYQSEYGTCELKRSGLSFGAESQINSQAAEVQRFLASLDQCEMARLIAGDSNLQITFVREEPGKGLLRTPGQGIFEIFELVSMNFVGIPSDQKAAD